MSVALAPSVIRPYILCVDFDGVLHSYSSGWKGEMEIPDPPVPGAFEWLARVASSTRFEVNVYSSRSKFKGGVAAMKTWFRRHGFSEGYLDLLKFPTQKPAASMTIDDRAFRFEGDFPTPEWLLRFKPWNKK